MKCANGCDAPVCPPSKVICRSCMDRITANLEEIRKRMEAAAERAEIFARLAEIFDEAAQGPLGVFTLPSLLRAEAAKGEEPRVPKVGDAFWSRMERMEDSWVTETVTEAKELGFTDSLGRLYSYADEGKTWRWPEGGGR